jgi:hypothetical protein
LTPPGKNDSARACRECERLSFLDTEPTGAERIYNESSSAKWNFATLQHSKKTRRVRRSSVTWADALGSALAQRESAIQSSELLAHLKGNLGVGKGMPVRCPNRSCSGVAFESSWLREGESQEDLTR